MHKYTIQTHKRVDKFFASHPEVARQFIQKIHILEEDPISKKLDIKPLKWEPWCYRLRVWWYRILYKIHKEVILIYVYQADSRWDIYKA